ncbi:biosynthetic arginine decarboxylase [bacterium]|nr:biosynthetic arginine decarboxylase [bacterium]
MDGFSIKTAKELYGIDSWGAGYFDIDSKGYLSAMPTKNVKSSIPLTQVLKEAQKKNISTPILLRFPQILHGQVQAINNAFATAIKEYKYKNQYTPAYPIKVNQKKSVVDAIMEAGYSNSINIEVGSKAEAVASFALKLNKKAMTICNGFKDKDYYNIMATGEKLGRNMLAVIEKPFELDGLLQLKKEKKAIPSLGFRIKLDAKGSGMWQKSGGSASKFGLSMSQLLQAIEWLKKHDLIEHLKMFHFHIGSQITDIRKIKQAIREAARVYAKCKKIGLDLEFLNVGGGLGIDYDGSKTSSDASVNYGVQEYANDVVYNVLEICNDEQVSHPQLISESGRFLTAYHAVLLVDVRDQYHERYINPPKFKKQESKIIQDILYIDENMTAKNFREFYHDSLVKKDELQAMFHLGLLSIEDRSKGEWLFWAIAEKAVKYSQNAKYIADEFVELREHLYEKVVCNFSLFQSLPDHWALDQLFPIMPISHLQKKPTQKATLVDITCDSDGEVDKFVDLKDIKSYLDIHQIDDYKDYHLAFLFVGAYQDTMGDMHNLFGEVNELSVTINKDNTMKIDQIYEGEKIKDTIAIFDYFPEKIINNLKNKNLTEKDESDLKKDILNYCNMYTYLMD